MTFPTNQMVMPSNLAIETCARAGMVQPPNHAEADELFQSPIHGGPREIGNAIFDGLVHLVGRRMVVSFQNDLQSRTTLYCQRQPARAAQGLELLYPMLDFSRVHIY